MAMDSRAAVPGAHHVVHDQYPALRKGADQRAAFAVVLGFLAVVGKRHIAAQPRQLDGDRRAQRNAPGRAEDHVEFEAAGMMRFCIELREPAQFGAIVEQAGVEKYGLSRPALV